MNTETHEHIVKSYDTELARLTGEIVSMGDFAGMQLTRAMQALATRDGIAAQRVIDNDDTLDAKERQISADVLRLLALRQPFAGDLREVLAALRIAADIERIGDYAASVAKRSIVLNESAPVPLATGLPALATLAGDMLHDVLHAYETRDARAAALVWERDDKLDARYTGLFRELLTYMIEDPHSISACTHLLFIAKHLERIGDHATNIAENIWFAAYGSTLTAKEIQRMRGVSHPTARP
ncbi:MAG: phosphate signaling complex protein PhoU [Nevskiaceae bacterium]|nr:MAG: phosphate signaling complex protein PhoU [Nevskiaceae bacterium]TBR73896.1 MAG: phosphate signaling complex protein PhoU [Nevskiaceae bacterium]